MDGSDMRMVDLQQGSQRTPAGYSAEIGKTRLLNALVELLEEKPFSKISVSDIHGKAGVSRQTFYRHFENKYDIGRWLWLQCASRYLFRVGRDMTWRDSLRCNFRFVKKYAEVFAGMSEEGNYEATNAFAMRCRVESLHETIRDYLRIPLDEELAFQIDFLAAAEERLVLRVFGSGEDFDPDRLANLLEACVPQKLHDLLDDAAGGGDSDKAIDERS